MNDVAYKHQKRIAKDTLRMTPAGALIMGGMTFEQAYKFVFNTDLRPRLAQLIAEYGDRPEWLSWELDTYGWTYPKDLLDSL